MQPMPVQRPRSKIENLIFMTESNKETKDEVESSSRSSQHASMEGTTEAKSQGTINDPEIEPSSMQRPVDLYKVAYIPYLELSRKNIFPIWKFLFKHCPRNQLR